MHVILISILVLVPTSVYAVDCRGACHACHAKDQAKEMLDIYCAMCHECKERRKERIKTKIQLAQQLTTTTTEKSIARGKIVQLADNFYENAGVVDSFEEHEETTGGVLRDIPEGCPTAPPCSDDEDVPTRPPTTTRTTTTTPKPTCPPIRPCKKKTTPPSISMPCMPCCPMPPCMLPCYPFPPGGQYPATLPGGHPYPMPSLPPLSPANVSPILALTPVSASSTPVPAIRSKTESDYLYMYVGVPKNMLRRSL